MKTIGHTARPGRAGARGFSLVELMVALVVGLILVAGLATLFANSSQSSHELDKSIRQIENGRYAVDLLSEDLSVAGFYGEVPTTGLAMNTATACATAIADLGWDDAAAAAPVPLTGFTSAQSAALACLPNRMSGSVALVTRRLDTTAVATGSVTAGVTYVQSSRCNTDPSTTRFIVGSAAGDFTLRTLDCSAINAVRRYVQRIYYVAACNECGIDNIPTLKRAELVGNAHTITPLVEGIEEIAYEYGFDTDGNGTPDVYRTTTSGVVGAPDDDWANVMAVRIHVRSRTTEPSAGYTENRIYSMGLAGNRGPYADNFKRRVYTVTARMNNPAGARETP